MWNIKELSDESEGNYAIINEDDERISFEHAVQANTGNRENRLALYSNGTAHSSIKISNIQNSERIGEVLLDNLE